MTPRTRLLNRLRLLFIRTRKTRQIAKRLARVGL